MKHFQSFWSIKILPILALRVILGKVATRISLVSKGINLSAVICSLYLEQDKTITHLFYTCNIASTAWNLCRN